VRKLFGVDPAPSKKSVVFDGERFYEKDAFELKKFFSSVDKNCFVSWDAPLGDDFEANLFYKPLEKILNSKNSYIDQKKPPKGISTLPFASCPHWSISQYVLGYPIINKDIINKDKLFFYLVQSNEDISFYKSNLFETHPAFSMWVFLKDKILQDNWQYKGTKDSKKFFYLLTDEIFDLKITKEFIHIKSLIKNDDYLDSFVSFLNLKLFIEKKAFVYGNKKIGAMLLPDLKNILKKDILCSL